MTKRNRVRNRESDATLAAFDHGWDDYVRPMYEGDWTKATIWEAYRAGFVAGRMYGRATPEVTE